MLASGLLGGIAYQLLDPNGLGTQVSSKLKRIIADEQGKLLVDDNGIGVGELEDGTYVAVREGAETIVLVKDILSSRILKTISKWDNKLGKLVDYPKFNNVALGKDMGGQLKKFGDEVGANVWTTETQNIFTTMYDLPDSWSFQRSITSVLDETIGNNQGKILFDINQVDIQKAINGEVVYDPLNGLITEFELQLLMRNKNWYDNAIFHENGIVLTIQETQEKGIKYLGL